MIKQARVLRSFGQRQCNVFAGAFEIAILQLGPGERVPGENVLSIRQLRASELERRHKVRPPGGKKKRERARIVVASSGENLCVHRFGVSAAAIRTQGVGKRPEIFW